MGDWAITTDSTCLSERSAQLEALSRDEKLALLVQFYGNSNDDRVVESKRKSPQQVETLLNKNSRSFAKLVSRIERMYGIPVVAVRSTIQEKQNEEL
jgi:hypothetical protein